MQKLWCIRLVLILGALAILATASGIAAESHHTSLLQSYMGPQEPKTVRIKLIRNNGGTVVVSQSVGNMILLKLESRRFGLVVGVDDGRSAVSITLVRIEDTNHERLGLATELETFQINGESPTRPDTLDFPLSIMMERSGDAPLSDASAVGFRKAERTAAPSQSLPRTAYADLFQDTGSCCVTCEGMQSCACAVEADCGSCCAPRCCGF
jgi:hypothetical protein